MKRTFSIIAITLICLPSVVVADPPRVEFQFIDDLGDATDESHSPIFDILWFNYKIRSDGIDMQMEFADTPVINESLSYLTKLTFREVNNITSRVTWLALHSYPVSDFADNSSLFYFSDTKIKGEGYIIHGDDIEVQRDENSLKWNWVNTSYNFSNYLDPDIYEFEFAEANVYNNLISDAPVDRLYVSSSYPEYSTTTPISPVITPTESNRFELPFFEVFLLIAILFVKPILRRNIKTNDFS